MHRRKLLAQLDEYRKKYPQEGDCVARFVELIDSRQRCFERDCWAPGHITGSAWVVNADQTHLLMTHHVKLNIWVQLGGHSDGDSNTPRVARREAEEESGIVVRPLTEQIFDLDIHEIPARKADPAHFHFDVRYAYISTHDEFTVSAESHDLAWVDINDIEAQTNEASILRMRDKWFDHQSRNRARR